MKVDGQTGHAGHSLGDLLPAGTPIDLDNCAREPIHIPGSVQPRGVLAVVGEPEFEIRHVSANVADLLGRSVEDVLGRHLSALVGRDQATRIERAASTFGDLRQRNPLDCVLEVAGKLMPFDAILHREPGGLLVVELEIAYGERPFSFPNTYQAVRHSVEDLNRAATLPELYDTTARAVRELTGFDRVMVYFYDAEYNGEVVAEAKREDLAPLLGLHYPASDIPAQARAMYEKSWLRLISTVSYTPAPIVPALDPATGAPLDLTHATLRSVSPIHLEYLQNMGVRASMSISLLRNGRLWGLIACHHYSGPHLPPYGTRAAAEFLGSTLSLRLVDKFDDDRVRDQLAAQEMLTELTAATLDEGAPLTATLLGVPDLLDLLQADGVIADIAGVQQTRGSVPHPTAVSAIVTWARETGREIVSTDQLYRELPGLDLDPQIAAGALAVNLPDGQFVLWLRGEVVRHVDWGGDPNHKVIAAGEGADVRIGPRKSFERWRETVNRRSPLWTPGQTETADSLRRHLVESLYRRTQSALRVAETLQRSLLPQSIPTLDGWHLSAHYQPAAGGRVGGDWYDAFTLRDGRLIVLLGDVAGHGLAAAGTMAQLRNVLRAQLFTGADPAAALHQLNDFAQHLMPRTFATVIAMRVELATGRVEAACAGHPRPYLVDDGARGTEAPVTGSPPIVGILGISYKASEFTIDPGRAMVLYSDGLVERRGSSIDDGLDRLADTLAGMGDAPAPWISTAMESDSAGDDVTIVTLRRL